MKRLVLGLVFLVLGAGLAWRVLGGLPGLVATTLPDFPEFPAPTRALTADTQGSVYFASETPFDFEVLLDDSIAAQPTTGTGTLTLPPGASPATPVPAAVVLHGSGGIAPGREHEYAAFLAEHGIAALVVDYYAPRGMTPETPYALRVVSVTEFDAVADAYGALDLLARHPAIDPDRIALMGFSYGGMAARIAMDERVRRTLAPERNGFAAFVDFYGPCFQAFGTEATNGAPLLTLRGTEDRSNDLAACREREAELRALGVTVESRVYPGAAHAWENHAPRALREDAPYVAGCTFRYDPRGRPAVRGVPIADLPADASRADRIAARMQSGRTLLDCVKTGYIVGRDDTTHEKAQAALLAFLRGPLGP